MYNISVYVDKKIQLNKIFKGTFFRKLPYTNDKWKHYQLKVLRMYLRGFG